jgi:hypothetical protein
MPVRFGLTGNGRGTVADMFTPVAIGQDQDPDVFTCMADGITAAVVMHGAEDTGDNFSSSLSAVKSGGGCLKQQLKYGNILKLLLPLFTATYLHPLRHFNA